MTGRESFSRDVSSSRFHRFHQEFPFIFPETSPAFFEQQVSERVEQWVGFENRTFQRFTISPTQLGNETLLHLREEQMKTRWKALEKWRKELSLMKMFFKFFMFNPPRAAFHRLEALFVSAKKTRKNLSISRCFQILKQSDNLETTQQ